MTFAITPLEGDWGFFAHRKINRLAVFTLPGEMFGFYKTHIAYLTEQSTAPDARRYLIENEAPRHYIDLDVYGDSALDVLPTHWSDAVAKFSEDSLLAFGVVPWHIGLIKYQLTEAFKTKDAAAILKLSADLGHYIADAHVPLHTTENYNGQLTDQVGIHGFWESRLPELYFSTYDLFTGKAIYYSNAQEMAWQIVAESHQALDSVLLFEKQLSQKVDPSKKYGYELRGNQTVRVYSETFSNKYHSYLSGMVERRMKAAIHRVGGFWYTCWVDAGQPDLEQVGTALDTDTSVVELRRLLNFRNHESGEVISDN